jgi:GcrA cell cycle regulator
MGWTTEKIELLKELWDQKLKAHEIAERLGGVSRNAVIGKAHRLKLTARRPYKLSLLTPEERKQRDRERHERWRRSIGIRPRSIPKPPSAPAPSIDDEQTPMAQRVFDCQELENHHCRWPVGEPGKIGFFFCGSAEADMRERRPYCPAHTLRATAPSVPRVMRKELVAA